MTSSISLLGTISIIGNIYNDEDKNNSISAIDAIGDFLIVGADESNKVKVLKFDGTNYDVVGKVELNSAKDEIDIEGIASEDNTVYVVGSHSWKRKKIDPGDSYAGNRSEMFSPKAVKAEPDRDCLCRFHLDSGGIVSKIEETNLRSIIDNNAVLKAFSQIPSKENGVDIEGIAVRKEQLYIGFRGPVLRGNLVPILKCKFSNPITSADLVFVNLGGRGIRDLTRVDDGFLVLAGPVGDGPGSYQVYFWDGEDCLPGSRISGNAGRLELLVDIPVSGDEKPEGLARLNESNTNYEILIVYDNVKNGKPTRFSITK